MMKMSFEIMRFERLKFMLINGKMSRIKLVMIKLIFN